MGLLVAWLDKHSAARACYRYVCLEVRLRYFLHYSSFGQEPYKNLLVCQSLADA